nr:hypothetical protein [Candidatus Kryptobacter tengchongensis]
MKSRKKISPVITVSIPHRYDSHEAKILLGGESFTSFQSLTGTIHTRTDY